MSSARSPSFVTSPTSQLILILQAFRHFTYTTAHSPTIPSLYLRLSSLSNPSVATPTSQLILQPFFRLSYVTGFSLTLPGEPPMHKTCVYRPLYMRFISYDTLLQNAALYEMKVILQSCVR